MESKEYKMEEKKPKSVPLWVFGVVVGIAILALSGGGVGLKFYKEGFERWKASNDSLIRIEDTLIAREEKIKIQSDDSIRKIRESKTIYIDNDLKWKRKYEALQKDYDVILYKLYSQEHLDSLAKYFLFSK